MADERKTYIYEPSRVSVVAGGTAITGFAQGTFVRASYDEDAVTFQPGLAHGAATLNPNRSGSISFTLLQTAEANAVLQVYASRVRARQSGWYFPVLILNNSGGESVSADAAWIVKEPEVTFAQEAGETREWQIKTGNLRLTLSTEYEVMTTQT